MDIARISSEKQTPISIFSQPHPDWIPLRRAPFYYQRGFDLYGDGTFDASITLHELADSFPCPIRWKPDDGLFVVYHQSAPNGVAIDPTLDREQITIQLRPTFDSTPTQSEEIASAIVGAWDHISTLFCKAANSGDCTIFAQTQGACAPFSAVPVHVWKSFEIIDWQAGTARSAASEHLFAVHVAPPDTSLQCPGQQQVQPALPTSAAMTAATTIVAKAKKRSAIIKWYIDRRLASQPIFPTRKVMHDMYLSDLEANGLPPGPRIVTFQKATLEFEAIIQLGMSNRELEDLKDIIPY